MARLDLRPTFSAEQAAEIAASVHGLRGALEPLPSERDQNFELDAGARGRFVLKISSAAEDPGFVEAQHSVLARAAERLTICPRVVPTRIGQSLATVEGAGGRTHIVRLLTYVPGVPMARLESPSPMLLEDLGRHLGELDVALVGFDHPALHRAFEWDLSQGTQVVERYAALIGPAEHQRDVIELFDRVRSVTVPGLASLRRGAIHGDANDHNVLVTPPSSSEPACVTGLVDFGDMVFGWPAGELAIAAAYAVLGATEPLDALAALTAGYHAAYPLRGDELDAVYGLMCLRLCVSASMAAHQRRQCPDDPYLEVSQEPIRRTLPRLLERPFGLGRQVVRDAAASGRVPSARPPTDTVAAGRAKWLGPSLSLGYRVPLHVRRGYLQYLFDADGRRLLDAYNNVPHVGHCHPRVVAAAVDQQRRLNTNTRYLYDALPRYAQRLASTLPDPLSVCFLVNSATEANELALRLARAATGRKDVVVLEAAYHGHTTSLIDVSPYKHGGPGGTGAPEWVHVAALPDLYRGRFRESDPEASTKYAGLLGHRIAALEDAGRGLCAFLAETCPSVAGQIMLPAGYLEDVYGRVRAAGGLCIADEVQTGYGRLGDCFYAFERHGVVPDIVVLGKPIGNGHPIGAVITTPTIARAFDNGMEFFSTFGGNAVSCEVGLAVLDVVEEEGLMEHARGVGQRLRDGLRELARRHPAVGDVRGSGLFLGAELVADPGTRDPDPERASAVSNAMREAGVLIGTDGPDHNVLKIRPPMPFGLQDADRLLHALDNALVQSAR